MAALHIRSSSYSTGNPGANRGEETESHGVLKTLTIHCGTRLPLVPDVNAAAVNECFDNERSAGVSQAL
jgi:hypothetical protein